MLKTYGLSKTNIPIIEKLVYKTLLYLCKKIISGRHDSRRQEILKVSSQWLTVTRDFKFLVAMIHGEKRFQMSRRSDWLWREILDFSSPWLTATRDLKNSPILSLRQIWDASVGPSSQWLTATKGCQKHPKKIYLPKNTYFFGIDPSKVL